MALFLFRCVRAILVNFLRVWVRLRVHSTVALPAGAFILAPSHRSYMDTPMAAAVTLRRMRYMGKSQFFRPRILGRLYESLGAFPVHRETVDREALRRCLEFLKAGEALVVFPEGTRKLGDKIEDLYEGAAYLAVKAQLPIVPVGIGGTERSFGKGKRWIRPRRCAVVVGAPLLPPAGTGTASRAAIGVLTNELTDALQVVFSEAQRRCGIRVRDARS